MNLQLKHIFYFLKIAVLGIEAVSFCGVYDAKDKAESPAAGNAQ